MKPTRVVAIGCSLPFLVVGLLPAQAPVQEPLHWEAVDRMFDEAASSCPLVVATLGTRHPAHDSTSSSTC